MPAGDSATRSLISRTGRAGGCAGAVTLPIRHHRVIEANGPHRTSSVKHGGIVLPGALMLASMMLTTSAIWLEASIAHTRHAANVHEHLRAAHAADSALGLCADALRSNAAPVFLTRLGEQPQWTRPAAFDGPGAYEPMPSWSGSVRTPQCLIEAMPIEGKPDARIYWITARGFGAKEAVQARVQLVIVREASREDGKARERSAWRRIVTHSQTANR